MHHLGHDSAVHVAILQIPRRVAGGQTEEQSQLRARKWRWL